MNDFEKALREMLDGSTHFGKLSFVGRSCYGQLNDRVRARIEFATLGHSEHYEALRVTLLDQSEGKIDVCTLRFAEIWGKQRGIYPYFWNDGGEADWYIFHPSRADNKVLCQQLNDYLAVFEPSYGLAQVQAEPEMNM